jgi:hypothetical protein
VVALNVEALHRHRHTFDEERGHQRAAGELPAGGVVEGDFEVDWVGLLDVHDGSVDRVSRDLEPRQAPQGIAAS